MNTSKGGDLSIYCSRSPLQLFRHAALHHHRRTCVHYLWESVRVSWHPKDIGNFASYIKLFYNQYIGFMIDYDIHEGKYKRSCREYGVFL